MIRIQTIALIGVCLFPAIAAAHTFSIPDDAPLLSVTIPHSLEPVETSGGVEAGVSEERTFYVVIERLSAVDPKAASDQGLQMLALHGIVIEPSSIKQETRKINGLDVVDVSFAISDGTEKAGLILISTKIEGPFFAMIASGSDKGFKENADALKSITDSIRLIKK